MGAAAARKIVQDTQVVDTRDTSDTIRLWESYREQAMLWRGLALIQIPVTLVALLFCTVLWFTRTVTLNVPQAPLPGIYEAREIPDVEFIEVATNFVNLVATYQPAVARRQFEEARQYLIEPMLDKFEVDMLGTEIRAIENTNRTQIFFVDPAKTNIERYGRDVVITLHGDRMKIVAGKELPVVKTFYQVTLTTCLLYTSDAADDP